MFDGRFKAAFVVACLTLIAAGVGFRSAVSTLNVYLKKEPVELRRQLGNISKTLGPWQAVGTDVRLDEAMVEELGSDHYLTRRYAFEGSETDQIVVHLVYYTGLIDAVPHVPDRCLVAGGLRDHTLPENYDLPVDRTDWTRDPEFVNRATGQAYPVLRFAHSITRQPVTVRMPIGEFRLRTTEFRHVDRPKLRLFAGYFFIANGRAICTPENVRKLAFDKSDKYAYYLKVQFTMHGDATLEVERFLDRVSDLINRILPEVMDCLPDWAEVETHGQDGAGRP